MNKIRLATVFSGIGAIEFALKRLHWGVDYVFACDNGERDYEDLNVEQIKTDVLSKMDDPAKKAKFIEDLYLKRFRMPNYMQKAYLHNNPKATQGEYYQDIRFIDGNDYRGKVDLFVGGSPCQSFSTVGFERGLPDARGTLFFDYARLILEIQPKIFIYENVRGLLTHNKGHTWETISGIFNSLGYHVTFNVFNAKDFNIPQNRNRLIVVGTKENLGYDVTKVKAKAAKQEYTTQDFLEDNCCYPNFTFDENGDLVVPKIKGSFTQDATLTPLVQKYVLATGTKKFYTKPVTDLQIARPLLKTMDNHHRAGVDNYITVDKEKTILRALTMRECMRLMGFTDDYDIIVPKGHAYQQAGNSIVVDMLIAILRDLDDNRII